MRGSDLTPDVRETLAHELTHALQDQHFDLRRFENGPDGAEEAYRALYEADAVRVQFAFDKTLPSDQQQALDFAHSQEAKGANETGTAKGVHVGGDLAHAFSDRFGVGVFVRYVAASVDLPSAAGVKVGGVQAGGGLRIRF